MGGTKRGNGGLLFGFGIVLAGGCENRLDVPRGRGPVHYWWVGLGSVIGSNDFGVLLG
ncbi:hypothetical protein DMI65_10605 [Escherichia coli]|nr:hypothetical protein [Escherichia coli]